MKKYEVTTEFDEKKYFTDDEELIRYINELAEGVGYDKYAREDYIGFSVENAIDFASGYLWCKVHIREDKVLEITGNNEDGIDIEGIVDGKKFGQWYEDLEDFNNYFDTRLSLDDWENSVNDAKKTIEKYMQDFDCDEYTDEELFG